MKEQQLTAVVVVDDCKLAIDDVSRGKFTSAVGNRRRRPGPTNEHPRRVTSLIRKAVSVPG